MDLKLPEKRVFLGPANLWKRILAFIVDILILDFLVLGLFNNVAEKMLGGTADVMAAYRILQGNTSQMQALTMIFVIVVMLVMAYFVLLQYAVGQTIGCMLLNIYVVTPLGEKDFSRPGFGQCLLRNIFMIPTIPFIFLWVLDPLYFFFGKKSQRLTEWLSRTRVIEQFEL
jgi:uncharacterized RDD family membrane protein YckC